MSTFSSRTEVCCGIIFKGVNGEVLVDTSLLHPCRTCKPTSENGSHSELSSQQSSPQPEEGIPEADQPAVDHSMNQLPADDFEEEFDDADLMEEDPELTSQEESQDSIIKSSDDAQNFLTEAVLDLSIPKHELMPVPMGITAEM